MYIKALADKTIWCVIHRFTLTGRHDVSSLLNREHALHFIRRMHVTADPQIESKTKALNAGAITPHQDEWIFWRVEANGNERGRGGGALV